MPGFHSRYEEEGGRGPYTTTQGECRGTLHSLSVVRGMGRMPFLLGVVWGVVAVEEVVASLPPYLLRSDFSFERKLCCIIYQ